MAHAVWPQQAKISVISDEKERFNAVACNHDCSVAYAVAALGKNLLKSVDRGQNWQASGLDQAGLVDYVDVATDYDVWQRLGDKSRSWSAVSMDSSGRYISAAASGETIVSFNNTVPMGPMIVPAQCCHSIAVNWNTGKYQVATGSMGIYTSFDYGRHFDLTYSSVAEFSETVSDGSGRYWVAVAANGGILHSHNYGQSWNQSICLDDSSNEFLCSDQHFSSVSGNGATSVAVVGQKYSANSLFVGSVFLSTDFGATFWSIPGTPRDRQWSSVVLSKDGSYMITAVSSDHLGDLSSDAPVIYYGTVPPQSTYNPTNAPTLLVDSAVTVDRLVPFSVAIYFLLIPMIVLLCDCRKKMNRLGIERLDVILNSQDVISRASLPCSELIVESFKELMKNIDINHLANRSKKFATIRLRCRNNDVPELTMDEAVAIAAYTLELLDATGGSSLNNFLRFRDVNTIKKIGPFLTILIRGVRKLHIHCKDLHYRGIPFESWIEESHVKDKVVVWGSFTSVSRSFEEAKRFALPGGNGSNQRGIVFEIENFVGFDISYYSVSPVESEILLLPDSRFTVTDARWKKKRNITSSA